MRRRNGRGGWRQVAAIAAMLTLLVAFLGGTLPAGAATQGDIDDAIDDGLAWLVAQQHADGYWPGRFDTAETCLALVKLQERAYELGFNSPFAPGYAYSANVDKAWDWVFKQAGGPTDGENVHLVEPLDPQDHTLGASGSLDDPDTNGNGYGLFFEFDTSHMVYTTGICVMALAASGTPNRLNDGGLDFNGAGGADTFKQIAQDAADWLAWAQGDLGSQQGGWTYSPLNNSGAGGDNSFAGYATLGLAYAEEFGCTVPAWVKTELGAWIDYIQCDSAGTNFGGSGYTSPCDWVNLLKTGNLIFEMTYVGIDESDQRFEDALAYIEDNWRSPTIEPGPGWGYSLELQSGAS